MYGLNQLTDFLNGFFKLLCIGAIVLPLLKALANIDSSTDKGNVTIINTIDNRIDIHGAQANTNTQLQTAELPTNNFSDLLKIK